MRGLLAGGGCTYYRGGCSCLAERRKRVVWEMAGGDIGRRGDDC